MPGTRHRRDAVVGVAVTRISIVERPSAMADAITTSWASELASMVSRRCAIDLIGEDDHRQLKLFGDVEGVDRRVKRVLDVACSRGRRAACRRGRRRARGRGRTARSSSGCRSTVRRAGRSTMTSGISAIDARPSNSDISERPGPEVAVIAFAPANEAPTHRADRRELVLGLQARAAEPREPFAEQLQDFRGRRDRIAGEEAAAGVEGAERASLRCRT